MKSQHNFQFSFMKDNPVRKLHYSLVITLFAILHFLKKKSRRQQKKNKNTKVQVTGGEQVMRRGDRCNFRIRHREEIKRPN